MYEEEILDHGLYSPYHKGELPNRNFRGIASNPACGDEIVLDCRVEDGIVVEAWFHGTSCVLSQAGASMLCEYIEGKALTQVQGTRPETVFAMFGGKPSSRLRHGCCLMALTALKTIGLTAN